MANESEGQKIVGFLRKVFPIFQAGAAFGGPVAVAAAAAVGRALGSNPPAPTPDAIEQAVAGASPDQLIALKKAEQQYQVDMAQIQLQYDQANQQFISADLASARIRETDLAKAGHPDHTARNLAYLVVVAFVGSAIYVLSGHLPSGDKEMATLAGTVLGYLISEAKAVLAYYFGNSQGQDRATTLLSQSPPIQKG